MISQISKGNMIMKLKYSFGSHGVLDMPIKQCFFFNCMDLCPSDCLCAPLHRAEQR